MILNVNADALRAYLESDSDCEAIGTDEYVADFYDIEKPVTMNITFTKKGVDAEAAAYLLYDSEQDGWYMGEQIDDAAALEALLNSIIA